MGHEVVLSCPKVLQGDTFPDSSTDHGDLNRAVNSFCPNCLVSVDHDLNQPVENQRFVELTRDFGRIAITATGCNGLFGNDDDGDGCNEFYGNNEDEKCDGRKKKSKCKVSCWYVF